MPEGTRGVGAWRDLVYRFRMQMFASTQISPSCFCATNTSVQRRVAFQLGLLTYPSFATTFLGTVWQLVAVAAVAAQGLRLQVPSLRSFVVSSRRQLSPAFVPFAPNDSGPFSGNLASTVQETEGFGHGASSAVKVNDCQITFKAF